MHLLHDFLSISMTLNDTLFILLDGDLCNGYTGKLQCLVAAILYQTHYYSLEPFGKVYVQVINALLKKRMPLSWCVHFSFWPIVYVFKSLLLNNLSIHFSHIFPRVSPDGFSRSSLWYSVYLLTREVFVAASPQARMCSDCGNLFITWFCLLPYSALSERNEQLWEINAIWIFSWKNYQCKFNPAFLFHLHKEHRWSWLSCHWDGLGKLEWQIKRLVYSTRHCNKF